MKSLSRIGIALSALTVLYVLVGCGPKTPDPNDPSVKQNASKIKPNATGGGAGGAGSGKAD